MSNWLTKLAMLCLLNGLACCSKESGNADTDRRSPDRTGSVDLTPADAGPSKPGNHSPTKPGDRTPTEDEQRVKSFTRHLDELEVQLKKHAITELEKRIALNKLRGVPSETPIDHTSPGSANKGIEGHEEAFNEYVRTALELQTLEAKVKLATEQLQRLREATSRDKADGEEASPK